MISEMKKQSQGFGFFQEEEFVFVSDTIPEFHNTRNETSGNGIKRQYEFLLGSVNRMIQELNGDSQGYVIFQVPGGCQFAVVNCEYSLCMFREQVLKWFPRYPAKKFILPGIPQMKRLFPKQVGISTKSVVKASSLFLENWDLMGVRGDRIYHALSMSDGSRFVAVDGKYGMVVNGDFGGTEDSPLFRDRKGKEIQFKDLDSSFSEEYVTSSHGKFLTYLNSLLDNEMNILVFELFEMCNLGKHGNHSCIHRNLDGSMGILFSSGSEPVDDFEIECNIQEGSELLCKVNPSLLFSIVHSLFVFSERMAQIGTVEVGERMALVFHGMRSRFLLMPILD